MGKKRNRSKARKKAKEQKMAAANTNTPPRVCYGHPVTRAVRLNEKAWLWGGSEIKMRNCMQGLGIDVPDVKFSLGFDLAGYGKLYQKPSVVEGTPGAVEMLGQDLFYSGDSCEAIAIDWPDGGVPALSRRWWEMLAARLAKMDGHVAVNCYGGHGRTGTFLAIIACLLDEVPYSVCPVEWIREKMGCEEQVETYTQTAYIERVTGRKVTSDGSHVSAFGTGWYSANTANTTAGKGAAPASNNANDYLEKVKKAAAEAGFKVSGDVSQETGSPVFEIAEEDAGAFQTWLEDYDDRFDSIEIDISPEAHTPWEPHDADDSIFGDDGMDEFGNTVEDYRRMGWMI